MRTFYEEWADVELIFLEKSSVVLFDFMEEKNRQMPSDDPSYSIRQILSDELADLFFLAGFSRHLAIIQSVKDRKYQLFYLQKSGYEFWSYTTLKKHLRQKLHTHVGALDHNFDHTLPEKWFKEKALLAFRDEMILDFVNIQDTDEEPDERVLEYEIVQNIKKFIMALGADFCFIGNQYRLIVSEEEYFIDLLFFNRALQSLVAIELKKGKFKAEYFGKMNLYLSALDEYVKQPNEKPSIGIILCREKNQKIVEFSFRDTSKPMGVITYKTYKDLPEKYKKTLPKMDDLKKLL